jgi:hypothetical protein
MTRVVARGPELVVPRQILFLESVNSSPRDKSYSTDSGICRAATRITRVQKSLFWGKTSFGCFRKTEATGFLVSLKCAVFSVRIVISRSLAVNHSRIKHFLHGRGGRAARMEPLQRLCCLKRVCRKWSAPRQLESFSHRFRTGRSAGFMFEMAASNSTGGT